MQPWCTKLRESELIVIFFLPSFSVVLFIYISKLGFADRYILYFVLLLLCAGCTSAACLVLKNWSSAGFLVRCADALLS